MEAEEHLRRRSTKSARWFVIGYGLASLTTFLIGKPLIPELWSEDRPYLLLGYFLLGPMSTLAHSIWGPGYPLAGHWILHGPILTTYGIETLLLAGAVALWTLRWRLARWFGYIATGVLWLGSGFLTLMAMAYGA